METEGAADVHFALSALSRTTPQAVTEMLELPKPPAAPSAPAAEHFPINSEMLNKHVLSIPVLHLLGKRNVSGRATRTLPKTYLEGDVCGGAELGAGQLHVAIATQEVNRGHLVTFAAVETRQAAAHGLPSHQQTLGAILAVGLVTWAGLQQDHWRRILAEEPAEG